MTGHDPIARVEEPREQVATPELDSVDSHRAVFPVVTVTVPEGVPEY